MITVSSTSRLARCTNRLFKERRLLLNPLQCWSLLSTSDRCSTTTSGATTARFMENKVALVTGSTSGIGLGIARRLALSGCNLVFNGLGDQQLINTLTNEFSSTYKSKAVYVDADLTRRRDTEELCRRALQLYPNGIDILVNNAGFQHVCPIVDFPPDTWEAMLAVMLTAPFNLIRLLLPGMKKKGWGRIINVASVHGLRASPLKSAYVSAKHAIVGLTKTVALETAGSGVTCNAICPGFVDTPIFQSQVKAFGEKDGLSYADAKAKFLANYHPSKESVGIGELAEMVVFLCSDAANQMTGSSLVMDGGWTSK